MSVMKYKDPTTGEVKKVGAPKADTYTKTETDALLQTKANTSSVYTKTETDTLLQKKVDKDRVVNPNLLDNWYFGNPVNQREFSGENTNGGYFIDRWLGYNCSYVNGIIKIKKGMFDSSVTGYIIQRIDSHFSDKLNGMACTFSALVDGNLLSGTAVYSNTSEITYANKNGVRLYTQIVNGLVELVVVTDETTEKAISSVKLELGTTQTLAHQGNGNWVLNEIPDYGEQLARCQRYYNVIKAVSVNSRYGHGIGAGNNTLVFVPINVPLRAVPAITMVGDFFAWDGVKPHNATFRAFDSISTNGVSFSVTSSDMTAGRVFQLLDAGTGNSSIILDANL